MSKRGKTVTKSIKEGRRKAATERKAEYDKLTTEQKLARLPKDGAVKQRARLEKLLEHKKQEESDVTPTDSVSEKPKKSSSKKSKKSE